MSWRIMELDICGIERITKPSDSDIRDALSRLNMKSGGAFAILGPDDMTYIQVFGDQCVGFELEYQEGTADEHFRAKGGSISLDDVVETFILYRDYKTDWKKRFTFERTT